MGSVIKFKFIRPWTLVWQAIALVSFYMNGLGHF